MTYVLGEQYKQRIDRALSVVERAPSVGGVFRIPTRFESFSQPAEENVFRVCTATGEWPVETSKSVTFFGVTATPNTASVLNKIVSLPAPRNTNATRIVNVAKDGTQWYLVSFQMATATGVMVGSTQAITFIGTGATQSLSFLSPDTSTITVVTDLSAVFNTSSCSITVNKATATLRLAGPSQTATIFSVSGTQTAAVVSSTFTATFVSLEI